MKHENLIEEMNVTALEQRIEFGCCGGDGGGDGDGDGGGGPPDDPGLPIDPH